MTASEFKALFPEFAATPDVLVEGRLAWAAYRTDSEIWGDKYAQGLALLTAHFLSQLPEAKDMRKGEKPGESSYLRERRTLNRIVASGYRVAGID